MTKVLHITSWYPNPKNPYEAIWIKNQIEALAPYVEKQSIIHIQVKPSGRTRYSNNTSVTNLLKKQILIEIPIKKWRIVELINFLILFWLLKIKKVHHKYDVINFHIAYPQLVYWKWLKKNISQKVIISEHWSAYHFNFGLPERIPRIQRIFSHNIPVITVSKALAKDIERYSDYKLHNFVVPNVIDEVLFYKDSSTEREDYFFMVSQWKEPKQPIVAIKAFHEFNKKYKNFKLKIGGFGPQLNEMKVVASSLPNSNIEFLGALDRSAIATHMRTCKAFLHPSAYETFSVVCAEAMSCGAPIVASDVGGIPEVITSSDILVEKNDQESWLTGMVKITNIHNYKPLQKSFSNSIVGENYKKVLHQL